MQPFNKLHPSQPAAFLLLIFSFFLFLSSCITTQKAAFIIQKKYAPAALQKDIDVLQKILVANHPSLYWYTPKDSMDKYFAEIRNSLTDSLNEFQFQNKIAWLVAKIRCGHTEAENSAEYEKATHIIKQPRFPLAIKTWGDSLIVLASAFPNDSVFRRGAVLTSINGIASHQLLDSMFQFISTDGYSDNFKSQVISFNFAAAYKNAFGESPRYTITYKDSAGQTRTATVSNYYPASDTFNQKNRPHFAFRPNLFRSVSIDSSKSTAYLNLTTFSAGRLRKFFRQTFRRLNKTHTKNLVIDLRENGGGVVRKSILLAKYLSDKNFHVGDTIAANKRTLTAIRYIHPAIGYWLRLQFLTHKKADGKFHLTHLEQHYFAPKKRNHFNGKIIIVQGGYTFSAATMLVSNLKGQQNVTIIGEESGGGSYGNSSINLPVIVLPHSHVRIVLPLYRCVFNAARPKTGRGIFPDIAVPPSSSAIRQGGVDPKKQQAFQLINNQ